MRVNSLEFRLFVTAAVWTLLVLPIAGLIIYSFYRNDFQSSFDAQLRKFLTAIRIDSMVESAVAPIAPINRYEPLFEVTHSGWYWQIKPIDEPAAKVLVSNSLATGSLPSPLEQGIAAEPDGTRWMTAKGPVEERVRIVEYIDTLGHQPGKPRFSIVVAGPVEWLDEAVGIFRNRLAIALALAGLALVAVTFFQVRFGLLPLKKIERGLAEIRSGDATKLEGQLPAEIEPLQTELNALIQSNQDIVDRARTQVGNLAHALKTPLAVVTNEARERSDELSRKVAEQAQIMRDQISHYLDRARMAARVGVIGRVTDVVPVVKPLVRALKKIYKDKAVRIHVRSPEKVRFQGEKHDLEEMLGNLLDNACKWANANVYLRVSVVQAKNKPQGPVTLVIDVEDDGPGLTAEQRAKIKRRGLRLDESKPGSGLGLSIVSDLAQSYRGSLDLRSSRHGGLLARLKLPGVQ